MNPFSKRLGIWLLAWLLTILISGFIIHFVQNLAVAFVVIMGMVFLTAIFILGWLTGMAEVLFSEIEDVNVLQPKNTIAKPGSVIAKSEKTSLQIPEAHFWGFIGISLIFLPAILSDSLLKQDWGQLVCFGPFLIFAGFFIGYISGPFLLAVATGMILSLTNPLHFQSGTIGHYLLPLIGMGIGYVLFTWPATKLTDRFSFIAKPVKQPPTIEAMAHLEETHVPNNFPQKKTVNDTSKKKKLGIWVIVVTAIGLIAKVLIAKKSQK